MTRPVDRQSRLGLKQDGCAATQSAIREPISPTQRPNRHAAVIAALWVAVAALFGTTAASYLLVKQPLRSDTSIALPAAPSQQTPQSAPPSAATFGPPYFMASAGVTYFKTSWGVSCSVTVDHVTCQTCVPGQTITNAYTCTDPAPGVAVSTAGIVDRNPVPLAASSNSEQLTNGQTYHANGWTIVASGGWARFINDTTGHGMAVAPQNFDSF
jgi:hypothetical protein